MKSILEYQLEIHPISKRVHLWSYIKDELDIELEKRDRNVLIRHLRQVNPETIQDLRFYIETFLQKPARKVSETPALKIRRNT